MPFAPVRVRHKDVLCQEPPLMVELPYGCRSKNHCLCPEVCSNAGPQQRPRPRQEFCPSAGSRRFGRTANDTLTIRNVGQREPGRLLSTPNPCLTGSSVIVRHTEPRWLGTRKHSGPTTERSG